MNSSQSLFSKKPLLKKAHYSPDKIEGIMRTSTSLYKSYDVREKYSMGEQFNIQTHDLHLGQINRLKQLEMYRRNTDAVPHKEI